MALWLNVASYKLDYFSVVSYEGTGIISAATDVKEAIDEIEAILNTDALLEELEKAKDMAEILNLM